MILYVVAGIGVSYFILFILSLILKDNSIADVFWGIGFLQVMIHSFILSSSQKISQIIILALILAWSLRIFSYILLKKLKHKGEDRRYAGWRKSWKFVKSRSFFQVYVLQSILLLIIAIPLFLINLNPPSLNFMFYIGVIISIFGLVYETIADLQLKFFLKKNSGKIMTGGLWKHSRHPNYFGESVFWFGLMISTIPISFFSVLSFLTITFLLRFISGVPLAERRYANNKEFQNYRNKTPAMFPNFSLK